MDVAQTVECSGCMNMVMVSADSSGERGGSASSAVVCVTIPPVMAGRQQTLPVEIAPFARRGW